MSFQASVNDKRTWHGRDRQPHLSAGRCSKWTPREPWLRAESRTLTPWPARPAHQTACLELPCSVRMCETMSEIRKNLVQVQWAMSPPVGYFPTMHDRIFLADLVLALLPASSALTHTVTHLRVQEGKYYTQRVFFSGMLRKKGCCSYCQ